MTNARASRTCGGGLRHVSGHGTYARAQLGPVFFNLQDGYYRMVEDHQVSKARWSRTSYDQHQPALLRDLTQSDAFASAR